MPIDRSPQRRLGVRFVRAEIGNAFAGDIRVEVLGIDLADGTEGTPA